MGRKGIGSGMGLRVGFSFGGIYGRCLFREDRVEGGSVRVYVSFFLLREVFFRFM